MSVEAITLRGPRVLLRSWRDADRAPFAALNADPQVMEHFPAPLTATESDALLARMQATLEAQGWGNWALEIEGALGGFTGLSRPRYETHFTPCVEVGWRLARCFWGAGYASEAAQLALRHGFTTLGLDEIVSFTATTNLRSQRVMQRIGMHRDAAGDFDHPRLPAGHPLQRHVLYRLARSAWLYSISS
jgi:RimJ/RimL family protein N-acetyltransferase